MCAERRKNGIRSLRGEILRFAAEKYGSSRIIHGCRRRTTPF